ncbi:hypothetical protein L1987_11203 [Smallanthus sonchifolius]|uniref:Uncharacterized protein n=1 Tax=Smallanthus sonchifolius TaxID=185202 RepID=A0ACB9JCI9_9ASTR|nr:hypothetical protein L1987_11203 [Smallanthus sonchifolius]
MYRVNFLELISYVLLPQLKATCLDASLSNTGKGKSKSYDSEVFHGFHLVKDVAEVVEVRFAMRDDRFAGYGHVEFATLDLQVRSPLERLFGQCVEISRMSILKDYDSGGPKWKVLFYVTRICLGEESLHFCSFRVR